MDTVMCKVQTLVILCNMHTNLSGSEDSCYGPNLYKYFIKLIFGFINIEDDLKNNAKTSGFTNCLR